MIKHENECWTAVVLIDCEANSCELVESDPNVEPYTLSQNLRAMLSSLQEDSSFKEQELKRARTEDDVSEYLLSPLRPCARKEQGPIGSAHLASFAAVLDENIRHHDFMLGRRNAQQFLREVLTVQVEDAEKNEVFKIIKMFPNGQSKVPILPLYGSAAEECPSPKWPEHSKAEQEKKTSAFLEILRTRFQAVTTGLLNQDRSGTYRAVYYWPLDVLV